MSSQEKTKSTLPPVVPGQTLQTGKTAAEIFHSLRSKFLEQLPDEDKEAYKRFGEKFHSSFDIEKGEPVDLSTINMEESLAYIVESLKSGLHPSYLTEDEIHMLRSGYGDEWFKNWGYTQADLSSNCS